MPVSPTCPGVYVQEIPSGVRTITGVSTSVALFIGRATRGPLNKPIQCSNFSDFEKIFSDDASVSDMARQVRLFFTNGGSNCYALRIASGAQAANVTLQTSDGTNTLILEAKQAGVIGDTIRARVEYRGQQPESTFNLILYRLETDASGTQQEVDIETWQNLSMDPNSSLFVEEYISQNSVLVNASVLTGPLAPAAGVGFSQSGLPVTYSDNATFKTAWQSLVGIAGALNEFQISVDGSLYVPVDLANIDVSTLPEENIKTALAAAILSAIAGTTLAVSFEDGPNPGPNEAPDDVSSLLRFSSESNGNIYVLPETNNDATAGLRLGTRQGGLEVSAYANSRPAPTGISMQMSDPAVWNAIAELPQSSFNQITLPALDVTGAATTVAITFNLETTAADDPLYRDQGLREKLDIIRKAINNYQRVNRGTFFWQAFLSGFRLTITPVGGEQNTIPALSTVPATVANSFLLNVNSYALGTAGTNGLQELGDRGNDGLAPDISDYDDAFEIARSELDLFNLLVLPEDREPARAMSDLYGPASVFCQQQRAFLLMDPPSDWMNAQTAAEGVRDLRSGLVSDHAAVFYPRITIKEDGLLKNIGASGAMAGIMARIDSESGVWKAPAGVQADFRGVVGLQYRFSDAENGLMNPRAVDTIRVFPNGIVNWGARTMAGDNDFGDENKYIPVRRVALYMEESLYRGLRWTVFEPNDESLWSQIRLNVGSFMNVLFERGAFQGSKPSEAYFVKCDSETTTQADRNLGIVNITVGFAPLKPAEFIVLSIQQIAGQLETG